MPGWKGWSACALLVASACGGRSGLGLADLDAVPPGGAATSGGAPATMGGFATRGGASATAGMATAGMATAGTATSMANGGDPAMPLSATSLSAGSEMSCATLSDGTVWCWGANQNGQLGDGTLTSSATPVRVKGISTARAVTAGGTWNSGGMGAANSAFGCALLGDGTVQCWGRYNTMLGTGNGSMSSVPVPIPGIDDALVVAGGDFHACVLRRGGVVNCWGDNWRGELGDDSMNSATMTDAIRLVPTPGISDASGVDTHGSDFSCAVLSDSSVRCWGNAISGAEHFGAPATISGVFATPTGLAVGIHQACAISPSGAVQCWSPGVYGTLSDGTIVGRTTAQTVSGLRTPALAVTVGMSHACAIVSDATLQCWGDNDWGQLGNGTYNDDQPSTPVAVSGLRDVTAVSAGYLHTCALTKAGSVSCWGDNGSGETGAIDEGSERVLSPVVVKGLGSSAL